VLFPSPVWPGLRDGTVTVAFRRWKRPTVKAGGTLQSPAGLLAIDEVAVVEPEAVSDDDARAAGYRDREDVLANLRPGGTLHRIRFHRLGEDPRIALRQQDQLDDAELAELRAALDRMEWAAPVLRLIADHPAVVSTELAARMGVERLQFKQRVRRLKALGLTESLETGYRLSPRGRAVLARIDTNR
jgi:hypothetical protein